MEGNAFQGRRQRHKGTCSHWGKDKELWMAGVRELGMAGAWGPGPGYEEEGLMPAAGKPGGTAGSQ